MVRRILGIVVLCAWLDGWTQAQAVDYSWINSNGGPFKLPLNWQPFDPIPPGVFLGPGGANDSVHFNLGMVPDDRYTVRGVSGANDKLLVRNDSLTLEFSGDYSLPSMAAGVPNFVVGVAEDDVADVVLTGKGGAVFQPHRTVVGQSPGSSGNVTVTGSDWQWDVGSQVMVGWYGTGTLTIENGAQVISASPLIGTFDDSHGTVAVRGAGSMWDAGGQMSVGVSGTAMLTVEDGGRVASGNGNIGNSSGSLGTVLVQGGGSRWDMTTTLFVGYDGTGELMIEGGGRVSGGAAWLGGWEDEGFGTAMVTVRGAGSSWMLDEGCPACEGGLTVGVSGSSMLLVEDGGRVSSVDGWIGLNASSSGMATVRGARARWENAGQLFIGDGGSGTLIVEAGAGVSSADAWLGRNARSTGTAIVRGAGAGWENGGSLFVGSQGSGDLIVEGGGTVMNDDVWLGLLVGSTGVAAVRGAGSTWTNDGQLNVGYAGRGTLVVEAGGVVSNTQSNIAATFGSTGTVAVRGAGSTWDNNGPLSVGAAGDGTLTIANGGTVTSTEGTIGLRGKVRLRGAGATWAVADSFTMEADDGEFGTLSFGIGSPTEHGLVDVSAAAVVGGELELTLIDDFVPDFNDTFTVLSAGEAITGVFHNVANGERLNTLEGLGSFVVHYGADSAFAANEIVLGDFLTALLAGDYNDDGVVDAADYTVWRDNLGAPAGTLPNDADGGVIGQAQYDTWKVNFGNTSRGGASAMAGVPEPGSLLLVVWAAAIAAASPWGGKGKWDILAAARWRRMP